MATTEETKRKEQAHAQPITKPAEPRAPSRGFVAALRAAGAREQLVVALEKELEDAGE